MSSHQARRFVAARLRRRRFVFSNLTDFHWKPAANKAMDIFIGVTLRVCDREAREEELHCERNEWL
ncbi:MAG: hypothetical protein ACRENG_12655 [bacterium]